MTHGKLVLVNGPTGSGKGSLVSYVREQFPEIEFSVSCTTRAMRPGDVEGKNYYFLTKEEFEARIQKDEFLEHAQYGGNYYGTLKSEVLPRLEAGKVVIVEIELQGIHQVVKIVPKEQLLSVYVDAGSWDALEARILARAPMSQEELAKRRARYQEEVTFKEEADVVIPNPDGGLEKAQFEFAALIARLFVEDPS